MGPICGQHVTQFGSCAIRRLAPRLQRRCTYPARRRCTHCDAVAIAGPSRRRQPSAGPARPRPASSPWPHCASASAQAGSMRPPRPEAARRAETSCCDPKILTSLRIFRRGRAPGRASPCRFSEPGPSGKNPQSLVSLRFTPNSRSYERFLPSCG
jgi:hypothetical protein